MNAAERKQRRSLTCVHFNGTQNAKCERGHAYMNPLPCLPPFRPEQVRGECGDCRFPTQEELDAEDRRIAESFTNYATARKAISAHIKANDKEKINWADIIDCPVCKTGRLSFRSAGAYNGHVHARCSTEGCVAWME